MYIKGLTYRCQGDKNSYPDNLAFLQHIQHVEFGQGINIFTGENGVGKSTLVETMAVLSGIHAEGGSRNNLYQAIEEENLLVQSVKLKRSLLQPKDWYFYRAESFYNLAASMDESDGYNSILSLELFGRKLHRFSRGESFKELVHKRLLGRGLYFFDEPESGLSFQSTLELMLALQGLSENDSQIFISTHSPLLLLMPKCSVFEISKEEGIQKVPYTETKLYQDWQMFFERGPFLMDQLFRQD